MFKEKDKCNKQGFGPAFWKEQSKHFTNRKHESLRSRYRSFLAFLTENNVKSIINSLEESSDYLSSIMQFEISGDGRKFAGLVSPLNSKSNGVTQ